jgi:hypothetical protein
MNTRTKLFVLASSGLSLLAMSSLSASARIVCNVDGDCWHVQQEYAFPQGAHVEIYPNDWHWKEGEHHAWKEHEGRGYWHGGQWEAF